MGGELHEDQKERHRDHEGSGPGTTERDSETVWSTSGQWGCRWEKAARYISDTDLLALKKKQIK